MPLTPYGGKVFGINLASGIMAAGLAANAEIVQCRFVDATELRKLRVLSVLFSAATDTTGFTAGAGQFDLVPARAWTADGSGGAAATLTGNNGKFRTSQNQMILSAGAVRAASTAALVAGTKTLDAQGIAGLTAGCGAAGTPILYPMDFLQGGLTAEGEPLIISHQEGFVVRASVPATGTWKFNCSILVCEFFGNA
jgi:hypothetical protein